MITCYNEHSTCAHAVVCREYGVSMVRLEHVIVTWCTLNKQYTIHNACTHVVLCRETRESEYYCCHKHAYHTSSSTGLVTLGLIYNTGIDTGILHTYPPKHMHVPLGIHQWATGQTQSTRKKLEITVKLYHKLEWTVCVYCQAYFIS